MSIVKNVNKLSLFLLGLVVAFNAASCGCKEDEKGAKGKGKPGDKIKVLFEFKEDANGTETLDADDFKEKGNALSTFNVASAKKGDKKEIEVTIDDKASKGSKTLKFVKAATGTGTTLVAEGKGEVE